MPFSSTPASRRFSVPAPTFPMPRAACCRSSGNGKEPPRSREIAASELGVKPRAQHRNGAAIGIVGGVDDQLVIGAQREPFRDLRAVVRLYDILQPVMRKPSVADQR